MAPTETPIDRESCWNTLVRLVARLIRACGTSAKESALALVNCKRAEEAADEQERRDHVQRRADVEQGRHADEDGRDDPN